MSFQGLTKEAFEALVSKQDPSGDEGHWGWEGPVTKNGTPYLWIEGKAYPAYRVAWDLHREESSGGKTLRCTCGEQSCINPWHREAIEVGTHTRGTKHGQARLSEEDILDIRERAANGAKQVELAQEFNVSQPQISMIIRRKAWAHVA